ncbi:hypothetical protein B0A50_01690 [Salinomyces thailandicus]|uniref:Uncharacterized protein n=1 Tax=Salinomyces thailandicus TaxID=706561 RepID=A0A4U0U8J1_9PEZI|nr:hypothetical protein B0A50_01690 [Salinomyces thailandica]
MGNPFSNLPQELRDVIHARAPRVAWIDITAISPNNEQATDGGYNISPLPPSMSRVSQCFRNEILDVFYGTNKFLFDLRGDKHDDYPLYWTPPTIYENWVEAMGDENAARLRSLSFLSHNFSAHATFSYEEGSPKITLKFRDTGRKAPLSTFTIVSDYSRQLAYERSEQGLRSFLAGIEQAREGASLTVEDSYKSAGRWHQSSHFYARASTWAT